MLLLVPKIQLPNIQFYKFFYPIKCTDTKTKIFYLSIFFSRENIYMATGKEGENQLRKQHVECAVLQPVCPTKPFECMTFKLLKVASEFGSV